MAVLGAAVTALTTLMAAPAAYAADAWSALAPVPAVGTGVEGLAAGATSSTLIVAAYGYDNGLGSDTNATRLYHITTDTWTAGTDAPLPVRSEEGSAVHKGLLYVVGGRSSSTGGVLSDLDRYDPSTDTWTVLAPMPTPRAGLGVAKLAGGIYAVGGRTSIGGPCTGGELAAVERYDIATNTWSPKASLPAARSDVGAMAIGGKLYAFGGCTAAGGVTSAAEVYDPTTDTWSPIAPLPTAGAAFYGLAKSKLEGPEIYIVGGEGAGFSTLGTTQVYKVASNSYDPSEPPMLTPRGEMGVAFKGGKVYAIGGAMPCCGASSNANEVVPI
jgi:N-acetylneuraminic acid mutarotase